MAILRKTAATTVLADPACTDQHCSAVSCGVNCTCKKNCWTVGHLVLVCDQQGNCCNCKCSCVLFDTPVQVPSGEQAIQAIAIGDEVVAYNTDFSSEDLTVNFSDGTDPDLRQSLMVHIDTGIGSPLVVTPDHVLLVAGPAGPILKRAFDLTPEDLLFSPSGETVKIANLKTGPAIGGIWNIATILEQPTSPDGHLIVTQGLISGDYALQLFLDDMPPKFKTAAKAAKKSVRLGTEEYAAKYKTRQQERPLGDWLTSYPGGAGIRLGGGPAAAADADSASPVVLLNTSSTEVVRIPKDHAPFLTPDQAARVRVKVPKRPYDDPMMIDGTRYLYTLAHAFYPDINFVIDWSSHQANGFAAREFGRSWIIIQGGLLRAMPVEFEATSLIISHLIARFMPSKPRTKYDYACTGDADYVAVQAVMRQLWFYSLFPKMTVPGINQLETLFKAIGGYTVTPPAEKGDKCTRPSLKCRIETYRAALQLIDPPLCAGPVNAPRKLSKTKAFAAAATLTCPPCDAPPCK